MKKLLLPFAFSFIACFAYAQNVGVGTSSPNQKLEVAGWIELGNQTEGTTGTAGSIRYHTTSKTIQYFDGTTWIDLLPATAAGDDDWTISGSNMYNANAGSIGIGTTTYTEKLNIGGDVKINGSGSTIGLSNVANGYLVIGNDLGLDNNEIMFNVEANFGTVGAQNIRFITNGSQQMTLDPSGNLGIGAPVPAQKLHVVGTTRISTLATGTYGGIVKSNSSGDLLATNFTGSTSDVLLGNGTFGPGSAFSDNLGNHTATTNLNMTNHEVDNVTTVDMTSGNGNGLRFWSSDSYKISMGNTSDYKYGPVTDYSIKMNMSNNAGRGWTWGLNGATPVAALNIAGQMQISGDMTVAGADIYVGTAGERIYASGDDIRIFSNSGYIDMVAADGSHGVIFRDYTGGSSDWTGVRHVNNGSADRFEFSVANGGYGSGLVLMQNNRVGIGLTNPSYSLHVSGKIKSDGITETSDVRLKKNIEPIGNALNKILSLNGVTYNWRVDEFPQFNLSKERDMGVIAQEIEKVFPEVVNTDDEGYLSVEYSHLVPALIEAIKDQQKIIDDYKAQVDGNTATIQSLQEQLDALTKDVRQVQTNGTITTNK